MTTDYIIRGIDNQTWRRVKARAIMSGTTVRDVLLQFLDYYADGDDATVITPPRLRRNLNAEMARAQKAAAQGACAECERSNGPHYRGPCSHGGHQ